MFYRVMGRPMVAENPAYKGMYRQEPMPTANYAKGMLSLWERYSTIYDNPPKLGITTELSLPELKRFAKLANLHNDAEYEVIGISLDNEPMKSSELYGIDVVTTSGYSMLGEGLFRVPKNDLFFCSTLSDANTYFQDKQNQHALFEHREHACAFLQLLHEISINKPGAVEDEDWIIVYIYRME